MYTIIWYTYCIIPWVHATSTIEYLFNMYVRYYRGYK